MKERIVIIFIAVTLGLLATTIGFFFYESSKPLKEVTTKPTLSSMQPFPKDKITLNITEPKDEAITANRSVRVKGKTDPGNSVIISTNQEDLVVSPTPQGDFTATITIDAGVNKLVVEAISPDGDNKKVIQTISFTSEQF